MTIETTLERPLPQNIEAERSVLGAVLMDNHALNTRRLKSCGRTIFSWTSTGESSTR